MAVLLLTCSSDQAFHDQFETYGEPNPPPLAERWQTDQHFQLVTNPVDILWIIDDSCSMLSSQTQLAANMPGLARKLTRMDISYRVGFTTTSPPEHGALRPIPNRGGVIYWIEPQTPGRIAAFVYGSSPGSGGSSPESGLYAARSQGESSGFWRANSSAWIIIVSDEPDQPEYTERPNQGGHIFGNWFNEFRDVGSTSLIGWGRQDYQPEYYQAVRKTGGLIMDINEGDWLPVLDEWADQIETDPTYEFNLSRYPVDYKAITILVCDDIDRDGICTGTEPDDLSYVYTYEKPGWSYTYSQTRNSVLLDSRLRPLQDGDDVTVTYEVW